MRRHQINHHPLEPDPCNTVSDRSSTVGGKTTGDVTAEQGHRHHHQRTGKREAAKTTRSRSLGLSQKTAPRDLSWSVVRITTAGAAEPLRTIFGETVYRLWPETLLSCLRDPLGATTVTDLHLRCCETRRFLWITSTASRFEPAVHGSRAPNLVTPVAFPVARRVS